MPSAHISLDDLFQILSFYNRPQLFKFFFINRLFLGLLEERFATKPFANAILRIWTEKPAEGEEGQLTTPSQCHRLFVGIAILDNFSGNQQDMHERIGRMTNYTKKWQFYLDEEDKEIDLNDIDGLQHCCRILQVFQNGRSRMEWHNRNDNDEYHNNEMDAAYWTYNEEEVCFVHKIERSEEEEHSEFIKQLQGDINRAETQMRYINLREHLIVNNFNPTSQCPLSAKFSIIHSYADADGTDAGGLVLPELQHFLDSHLNSQKYIRLLSVEFSSQHACRVHKYSNNNMMKIINMPQMYASNQGRKLPTEILVSIPSLFVTTTTGIGIGTDSNPQRNQINNHVHIMSTKSIIVKYEDRANMKGLIDFIYQQSSLQCAVQIQLPRAFLEKQNFMKRVNIIFFHDFLQQLLQDFLLPEVPSPRTSFICNFFIHPNYLHDAMYFIGSVNLGLFTSRHIFRRINFDEDGENYESQKHISSALQRLIIDDEVYVDSDIVDSELGAEFYDSNTKDHWRLCWTQLSADLCEIKICQFNEERDSQFHEESNKERTMAFDGIKNWWSLELAYPRLKRHYFDQIGQLLGYVLHMIEEPLKVKEIISQHSAGRPVPVRLARLTWNVQNGRKLNFYPLWSTSAHRSEPDLRPIIHRYVNGESRWFVAIQDNQPRNDEPPEEMTFRPHHQLAKVYDGDGDDDDENGYFWAEIRGRYGLVIPAGKLGKIATGDLFLAAERRDGGGEQQQQPSWPANSTEGGSTITIKPISRSKSYDELMNSGKLLSQRQPSLMRGALWQLMVAEYYKGRIRGRTLRKSPSPGVQLKSAAETSKHCDYSCSLEEWQQKIATALQLHCD